VQIFNTLAFLASLLGFVAGVISFIQGLSPRLVAANAVFGVLMAFFYWLSRFAGKTGAAAVAGLAVLIFGYVPVIWLLNGGTLGVAPLFVIFFSSALCSLKTVRDDVNGKKWPIHFFTLSVLALAGGFAVLEYHRPDLIEGYATRLDRIADVMVTLLALFITNYIIITVFTNRYHETLAREEMFSREYRNLAVRDSMTLLYNHEKILDLLNQEIERASRYGRTLSLLMMDIDNFKNINDTCGHPFGDEVILALARTMTENCRAIDHVGRYGGEEFMMIFPETTLDRALIVANRILESFRGIRLSGEITVTFSGGLVEFTGESAEELMNRADRLLYRAKAEGKNRIIG